MGSPARRKTSKLNIGMHPGRFSPRYGEDVGTYQKARLFCHSHYISQRIGCICQRCRIICTRGGSSGQEPTIDVWPVYKYATYSALLRINPSALSVPYPFAGLPNLVAFYPRSYTSYPRKSNLSGIDISYHLFNSTLHSRRLFGNILNNSSIRFKNFKSTRILLINS